MQLTLNKNIFCGFSDVCNPDQATEEIIYEDESSNEVEQIFPYRVQEMDTTLFQYLPMWPSSILKWKMIATGWDGLSSAIQMSRSLRDVIHPRSTLGESF